MAVADQELEELNLMYAYNQPSHASSLVQVADLSASVQKLWPGAPSTITTTSSPLPHLYVTVTIIVIL